MDKSTIRGALCETARRMEMVSIWQAATLNSGRRRKALISSCDCMRLESATRTSMGREVAADDEVI